MRQLAVLIAFVAAIPVVGLAVSGYIRHDFEKGFREAVVQHHGEKGAAAIASGQLTVSSFCAQAPAEARKSCDSYENISILFYAAAWTLLVGLSLIGGIYLAARYAGASRALLVAVFSPGLKFVLVMLFALILAQGSILVATIFFGEAYAIQRVHGGLIAMIALGALVGAFSMIKAGLSIGRRAHSLVIGRKVSAKEQPKIFALVHMLAKDLKAVPPKNIVLGIAPNFYVTSADVTVFPAGETFRNETLYLSLPLLRVLSKQEIAAVIGHELGHFKGEDTAFSLRFYPIYAGTGQALAALGEGREGAQLLALLPAMAILNFFMDRFSIAENTIGRVRELEADKAGAAVASPQALGTALLKIGAVAPAWPDINQTMVHALNEGRMFANVSEYYGKLANEAVKPEHLRAVGETVMAHPTDTHPTTLARIEAFGLKLENLVRDAHASLGKETAADLVQDLEALEVEISDFEHRVMVETGQATLPQEQPKAA